MSPPTPVDDIVTMALAAEYKRTLNKLQGAERRLHYAHSQVTNETALLAEQTRDLDMLAEAILARGGVLPQPDPVVVE